MRFQTTRRKTKEMRRFSEKEWAIADTKHFGRPSRWKEEHYYIRAMEKDKIIGMLHYSIKAGVMEIQTVIVSHTHQGEGVGKALMIKTEEVARKKGIHKLFLLTGKGWDASKFYRKMGFTQTGELKKHYLKHDWVEFSKFLK